MTLERGVTHDRALEAWANLVPSLDSPISLASFRKDVIVDMFNEANQLALSYQLLRCWVSEFQALPELDANSNAIAIEMIKLERVCACRMRRRFVVTSSALGPVVVRDVRRR